MNKMTLDEFRAILRKAQFDAGESWDKDHVNTKHSEGIYDGLSQALELFDSNRAALEVGIRQPLRFARSCVHPDVYHMLQLDGDHVMWREFVDRDDCIGFATSVGLTAEFVNDKPCPTCSDQSVFHLKPGWIIGTGSSDGGKPILCPTCGGEGTVPPEIAEGLEEIDVNIPRPEVPE